MGRDPAHGLGRVPGRGQKVSPPGPPVDAEYPADLRAGGRALTSFSRNRCTTSGFRISQPSRPTPPRHPGRLRRFIEDAIETFEPRLTDVRVTSIQVGSSTKDRRVQFLIEADLKVDPDPERVEFDTVLEVSSGKFAVSSHDDADD